MEAHELSVLKNKIGILRTLYAILFGISMVILIAQSVAIGFGPATTIAWALSLGGAVTTRLIRSSMVNRYNAAITGGGPALLQ